MKIDMRQMEAAMKKMGIKSENIPADEVIIRGPKNYVIRNPQITSVDMAGQKSLQISGQMEEVVPAGERKSNSDKIGEEDVKIVMEKAGASEGEAKKALEETGDIAEAILKLTK